jgi:membrane protein
MNGSEMPRPAVTGTSASGHAPLWAIVLSAVLIITGYIRPRAGNSLSVRYKDGQSEDDWGRSAETPRPAQGSKEIALRVYRGISEDRILLVAAGVTFYVLLAIFPGIAALISIYGLFADPATATSHLDTIASIAPGGALEVLREEMTRLAEQGGTTLGVSFLVSLAISLWTVNSGVKALFDALNVVYEEQEDRGFLQLNALTLLLSFGIIVFILLMLAAIVAVPIVLNYIPLPGASAVLAEVGRWPILFALVTLALEVLYRYGPSGAKSQWRWISWGSVSAAIIWLAASALFSWYVANFGSYNKTYGSLGAIIGFMTWIWISIIVLLVGARLNAEMEHQATRDREWPATATGDPRRANGGLG